SGEVATMNISTGKFASSSPIPGRPSCLTLRGSLLWVSNESGVIDSFKLNPTPSNKSATILGMDAMSLRGREILLVSFHQSPRDSLALYVIHDEFGSISPLKSIESANARLRCSSFAPGRDGSLVLYDPHRDQGRPLVNQLHGHIHPLTAVAFSNDEAFMARRIPRGKSLCGKNEV
ncbi:WD repeatcontaining protein 13like, partial [Caligus rogercresseyi]